jgi:hypothetical protein
MKIIKRPRLRLDLKSSLKHGSEAIFDRSMLAKKGVVQVTVNYRLGIFGNSLYRN